jgi:hypothetical protein
MPERIRYFSPGSLKSGDHIRVTQVSISEKNVLQTVFLRFEPLLSGAPVETKGYMSASVKRVGSLVEQIRQSPERQINCRQVYRNRMNRASLLHEPYRICIEKQPKPVARLFSF